MNSIYWMLWGIWSQTLPLKESYSRIKESAPRVRLPSRDPTQPSNEFLRVWPTKKSERSWKEMSLSTRLKTISTTQMISTPTTSTKSSMNSKRKGLISAIRKTPAQPNRDKCIPGISRLCKMKLWEGPSMRDRPRASMPPSCSKSFSKSSSKKRDWKS